MWEKAMIRSWYKNRVVHDSDAESWATELYEDFSTYCQDRGWEVPTQTKFGRTLAGFGLTKARRRGGRWRYLGIGLRGEISQQLASEVTP